MIKEYVNSKITGGHYAFKNATSKKAFTNKMTEAMQVKLLPNDIVVDIGAYVGEYSLYCATKNVTAIYAYEPTPNTFELLQKNTINKKVIKIFNKAVVGNDITKTQLHLSKGIGVTNSIVKTHAKKKVITVPCIRYEEAIKNTSVVKIDVEGAEYTYNIFQPHIRAFIIEFHPISGMDWMGKAHKIMNQLENEGYNPLCKPGFENGWDMHGAWVKN